MTAYFVDTHGNLRAGEVFDDPPLYVTTNGRRYIYRDRTDGIAIYEEDESPTT